MEIVFLFCWIPILGVLGHRGLHRSRSHRSLVAFLFFLAINLVMLFLASIFVMGNDLLYGPGVVLSIVTVWAFLFAVGQLGVFLLCHLFGLRHMERQSAGPLWKRLLIGIGAVVGLLLPVWVYDQFMFSLSTTIGGSTGNLGNSSIRQPRLHNWWSVTKGLLR